MVYLGGLEEDCQEFQASLSYSVKPETLSEENKTRKQAWGNNHLGTLIQRMKNCDEM